MKGIFVTLEGPDGSGKSTMVKLIGNYLKEKNIDCITTREPGGTLIGEKIRDIVLDPENTMLSYQAEALLYAAARGQHVQEKIIPNLQSGKVVLCDRFLLSSLAYQGVGRDLGIEEVKMINDFGTGGLEPDLILFFHVNPEVTLQRKTNYNNGDRLEREGKVFHSKVYNGYMELLDKYPKNIKVIDASKSIEDVFSQSIKEIEKLLTK